MRGDRGKDGRVRRRGEGRRRRRRVSRVGEGSGAETGGLQTSRFDSSAFTVAPAAVDASTLNMLAPRAELAIRRMDLLRGQWRYASCGL
jgi:hypothetical protein